MRNSNTSVEHFHLGRLVREIDEGRIAIPEFQRDFDWNESDIRSLLSTVFAGWPAGSLLFLEPGEMLFKLRPLEGAPGIKDVELVVLDGQQRLTSLYQALYGKGDLIFAIKWDLDIEDEIDENLISYRKAVWEKKFDSVERQLREKIVPVSVLKSASEFFEWRDSIVDCSSKDDREELRSHLTALYKQYLSAIHDYEFPVVRIDRKVNPAAISRIFEKVNKTGLTLNAFDLMVAKSFDPGWNLRDQWLGAREAFPRLSEFFGDDGLPLLQSISLIRKENLRQAGVLSLSKREVQNHWWDVAEAADRTLQFLRENCGVLGRDLVPYANIVPPLIALEVREKISRNPEVYERWFWNAGFGGLYDVAANTRLVRDYKKVFADDFEFLDHPKPPLMPSMATKKTQKSVWAAYACAVVRFVEADMGRMIPHEIASDIGVTSLYTESEVVSAIGRRIATFDVSSEFRGALNSYLAPSRFTNPARKASASDTVDICADSEFGDFAVRQLAGIDIAGTDWGDFRQERKDWLEEFLEDKGVEEIEVLIPLPRN